MHLGPAGHQVVDGEELFDQIVQLPRLHLVEPRYGCEPRAQIIGTFLLARVAVVGRAWAMPCAGRKRFDAPLFRRDGSRFASAQTVDSGDAAQPVCIAEDLSLPLSWPHHVAACAETIEGDICVFDPALFDGPVLYPRWCAVFDGEQTAFLQTKWHDAPVHGIYGSPYAPGMQEEHGPDDIQRALLDIRGVKDASPFGVACRRHAAPTGVFCFRSAPAYGGYAKMAAEMMAAGPRC